MARGETSRTRWFQNRTEAGVLLGKRLAAYAGRPDVLILALPHGGVPVGFEIAKALQAPLDVLIVRKLGCPGQEELAMGAIVSGGMQVLNEAVVQSFGISAQEIRSAAAKEKAELERRERLYRGGRASPTIRGRTVILVDDGIATGTTMRVALAAVRSQGPSRLVLAVPVAPASTCRELKPLVDELVCLLTPEDFMAISVWYQDFSQTSDQEVCDLLEQAERMRSPVGAHAYRT